jgi:putative membrane protein
VTLGSLFNALVFVGIGIFVFACALVLLARVLPGDLWNEALKNRNVSAAVILAGIALALGWIVAAAVH